MLKSIKTQYHIVYTNDINDEKTAFFDDGDHIKVIFPLGHIDGYVVSASPESRTVTLEISDGVEYDIEQEQVVAISVFTEKAEAMLTEWKSKRRAE